MCVCFVEGCRTEYLEELTVASLCSELLTAGEEGKQRERERERDGEREKGALLVRDHLLTEIISSLASG